MSIPPIDLLPIVKLLQKEGTESLVEALSKSGKMGMAQIKTSIIYVEWMRILSIMEREIVPLLQGGCKASALVAPVNKLLVCYGKLSRVVTEVLSFMPGPVGMVCSVINAIWCFSTGNILGGIVELLGVIPGFKIAAKGAKTLKISSKLTTSFEQIMVAMFKNNKALFDAVIKGPIPFGLDNMLLIEQTSVIARFFEKHKIPQSHLNQLKSNLEKEFTGIWHGIKESSEGTLENSLKNPFQKGVDLPTPHIDDIATGKTIIGAQKELGKYIVTPQTFGQLTVNSHLFKR